MIPYIHKVHPLSRSLKLKVDPSGQVMVITPRRVSQRTIDQFVSEHLHWIQEVQNKLASKKAHSEQDDKVMIFGQSFEKVVDQDLQAKVGITLKGKQVLIKLPAGQTVTTKNIAKFMDSFLKATAEKYIVPRTHQLAKIMKVSFNGITLREQKSRWGSCSSTGRLNFNWRLAHYPTPIIDYVIIHELAHRTEMNHSEAFWAIVKKFDPEYLKHRGWLKRHGLSVG